MRSREGPVPIASLSSPPKDRDTHHWADYAELLCLTGLDGVVSKSDLLERWAEADDLDRDLEEGGLEAEGEEDELEPPAEVSYKDTRRAATADDVFRHLVYRSATFGAAYPFKLDEDGGAIRRRRASDRRRLYLFLLLASSLGYLEKPRRGGLTRDFELLAVDAMRTWLPGLAQVHPFGTARSLGSRYKGPLEKKLQRFASDVGERSILQEGDLLPGDVGDLGGDVVCWLPLGDDRGSLPIFIGQATCNHSWRNKQAEPGFARWKKAIDFGVMTNAVFFVPFCFRKPDGTWFRRLWVDTILLDRVRLMWLLSRRPDAEVRLPALVDEALAFRADVF